MSAARGFSLGVADPKISQRTKPHMSRPKKRMQYSMVCESPATTYTDANQQAAATFRYQQSLANTTQQAPSQPTTLTNTIQQHYHDSPGAIASINKWVFSHGCVLLYLNKPALMGWHVDCKYDKATAFASYKYDLLRRLSTSSVYALSHAVYESPRRPLR